MRPSRSLTKIPSGAEASTALDMASVSMDLPGVMNLFAKKLQERKNRRVRQRLSDRRGRAMEARIELRAGTVKTARTGTVNGTRTGTARWYLGFFGQAGRGARSIAVSHEDGAAPAAAALGDQALMEE
jgi:hypothetical protein